MKLWCWLVGHRWNVVSERCQRCGEINLLPLIHRAFERLQIFDKPVIQPPPAPTPLPLIPPNIAEATARLITAYAKILERPEQKPMTEVFPTLPEEVTNILEMARRSPSIRSRLPKEYQEMLEQKELEVG